MARIRCSYDLDDGVEISAPTYFKLAVREIVTTDAATVRCCAARSAAAADRRPAPPPVPK